MRTVLFTLMLLFGSLYVNAQTTLFSEDFEGANLNMTSSSTGTNSWGLNTTLFSGGAKSDSCVVTVGDTTFLTSNSFSTVGNSYLILSFDHICKIEFPDHGYIEVSNDSGATWQSISAAYYMGSGQYSATGNGFNSVSYVATWLPSNNSAIPTNLWWKTETFDISTFIPNVPNAMIRFALVDGNNTGSIGNYGWLIDNVLVQGSFSELIPPVVQQIAPIIQDTAYTSGPYEVNAYITDNTGIDTALLIYHVMPNNVWDTLGMNIAAVDTFQAFIPFYGYGRSISYYVKAIDASLAHNTDSTATKQFICKYSTGGDVIIGTSTFVNHSLPMEPYYGYSYSQSIFKSSYFNGTAGTITKLYYQYNGGGTFSGDAIIVYMGTTNINSFTSSSSWLPISNFTTVYNGTMSASAQGWVEITLQTPYNYSGSGNLVIAFEENTPGYHSSNDDFYCSQLDSDNSSIFFYNDSNNPDPNSPPTGTLSTYVPNVKLSFVSSSSIPHDIGISEISSPATSIISGQAYQINAKIKNYGVDTLLQASVQYVLDGVAKPSYSFSDTLLPGATSSSINIGTDTATTGAHHLKVWTENPNGISDYNILNDTANLIFFACTGPMSGIYTIGGASADFLSISDAVMGLKYCGINGPVTFNINNGIYNEHIDIDVVTGSSAANTITFQSASGDSSQVVVQYDANSSTDNYIFKLGNLSYFNFKGITWKPLDSDFSRAFVLESGANHITFQNNVFIAASSGSYANLDDGALIYADSCGTDFLFLKNRFEGGAKGVVLSATAPTTNLKFKFNEFINQYAFGVIVNYAQDFLLQGNVLRSQTSYSGFVGLNIINNSGSAIIRDNDIVVTAASNSTAIYFNSCNYIWYSPAYVFNNFFQSAATNSTTISAAIKLENTTYVNLYFNNARSIGTSQNSSPIALINTTSITNNNYVLKNNIFTNEAGGYVFYTNIDNSKYTKDYNFYYNTSAINFAYYNGSNVLSYSSFLSSTGGDVHSDTINPYFYSNTDLHVGNNSIGGLGIPITGLTIDIDGDTRNTTNPDPGADEFDPSPYDISVLRILAPIGSCGMDSNEVVVIQLKNVGSDTVNGNLVAQYSWPGNANSVSENVNAIILPGDTFDYTFITTANFNITPYGVDSVFNLHAWATLVGDIVHLNDHAYSQIKSSYEPPAPTVSNVTINYGTSTTLTAISNDSLTWWANDTILTPIVVSNSFTTPLLSDTTTYWVSSKAGSSLIKLTETVQYRSGTGHTNPYPSYLTTNDFDGIEITNLGTGMADIGGYTINVNVGSNMISYIFPSGTNLSSGSVALCIYGSSISLGPIAGASNVFGISTYSGISSGSQVSYWITDPQGAIVDAFASNGAVFPASSGVQPADFVGSLLGGSGIAGAVRIASDNNSASDWQLVNTVMASFGSFNSCLSLSSGIQSCSSVRVPLTVNVINFPTLDGSLPYMVYPSGNVIANTSNDVLVAITNYGTSTMTSATVNYRINGQLQSPISWTGSLSHGVIDTIILASNYSFTPGMYYIDAWAKLPNGVNDPNTFNDTTHISFSSCLSGTFTIGDTSGGANYDFPSFTAAIQVLQSAGACGDVTFNVAQGTYNEQVNISGINAPNGSKIVFQSANGDSSSVVLVSGAGNSTANYVLQIDDVSDVWIKGITIKSINSTSSKVVVFSDGASHNVVTNCIIRGGANIQSNSSCAIEFLNNGLQNYNTIKNNHISNAYYGIYGNGSSSLRNIGNIIENNIIDSVSTYGIKASYEDSISIIGNKISISAANISYGLYLNYSNFYKITENIINSYPSNYAYGIYIYYSDGSSQNHSLTANNIVSINGGTGNSYGLYNYYSHFCDVFYNTISINGVSTSSRAFNNYTNSSSIYNNSIRILNNIFADSVGYAAYFSSTSAVDMCDYNNYSSSIPNSIKVYWSGLKTTLSDLQNASSQDMNSKNITPTFYSNSDLHLFTTQLTGFATPLNQVLFDIDHEMRSVTGPTIGADEVPILPHDIGVVAINNMPTTTNENQSIPVALQVKNYGTDTASNFTVSYIINGGIPVSQICTSSIAPGQTISITMSPFVSPAGNSTICSKTSYVGDSNFFNDSICYSFFGFPVWDAQVSSIEGLEEGCGLTMDTVNIWIKNNGIDTINGSSQSLPTNVKFSSNSSTVVSETFTTVINPGDSLLYTFTNLVSLATNTTTDTIYNIAAWIELPNDNVSYNDTAYKQIESLHTPNSPTVNSPINVSYASNVTLTAISTDTILWYNSLTSTNSIAQGPSFTIPGLLYSDTTFYVEARAGVPSVSVVLGNGTINSYTTLTNGWYNYSWSENIYDANEIQSQGTIDTLYVQLAQSVSGFTMSQQTIYLSHTTQSTFASSAYPGTSGQTLVYSGTITWSGNAGDWIAIPLQTSFNYNGQDNLLLHWENHDGSYTSGYPHFYCTSNTVKTIYAYQDVSFPIGSGNFSSNRPNLKFNMGSLACSSARIPIIVQVANPAPIDAGVISINTPNTGVNLSSSETVNITVKNYGLNTLTSIPVAYSLSGGAPIFDTINTSLQQGAVTNYSFSVPANVGQVGLSYTLKSWTALANDGGSLNDTTFKTIHNNLPSYCNSTATSAGYEEITNVTLGNLNNTSTASGAKYTDFTQTVAPANLAPGANVSLSITSDFAPGYSSSYGCYVKMFIDFNRDGDFDDNLEEVFASSTTSSNTVTGNVFVPGNAIMGLTRMRVVFREGGSSSTTAPCGTYSWGETEDYTVSIAPIIPQDAGVSNIIVPTMVSNSTQSVSVVIKNYGSQVINSMQLSYTVNNGTASIINYNTPLAVGASATVNIGNISLQAGSNTICASTTVTGDNNTFNDQKCKNVFLLAPQSLSYSDNFESNDVWLPDTIANQWERGTPQMPVINAAHSGSNVWAIDLDGNYLNNSSDYLYSPTFNTTNIDSAYLSFWQFMNVQSTVDLGVLQISTGNGTWANLGYIGDPNATNWYNSQTNGLHSWSMQNLGWLKSTYFLDFTDQYTGYYQANSVQFRFYFVSNSSVNNYDGWAIDDFKLMLPAIQYDAGVVNISTSSNSPQIGSQQMVTIEVKNWGYDNLNNIPVSYTVNGVTTNANIQLGAPLAPGNTTFYTFLTGFTTPGSNFTICASTSFPGDTYLQNNQYCKNINVSPADNDAGIDLVEIFPTFGTDSTMVSINDSVRIKITNYGNNTITSLPVRYFLNTSLYATETWTGNLQSGNSVYYVFNTSHHSPLGNYNIIAEAMLPNDANNSNDTAVNSYIGIVTAIKLVNGGEFRVYQNQPNPVRKTTNIKYYIPRSGKIIFKLFDSHGRLITVKEIVSKAFNQTFKLDVSAYKSGIYYYSMSFEESNISHKMIIIR